MLPKILESKEKNMRLSIEFLIKTDRDLYLQHQILRKHPVVIREQPLNRQKTRTQNHLRRNPLRETESYLGTKLLQRLHQDLLASAVV